MPPYQGRYFLRPPFSPAHRQINSIQGGLRHASRSVWAQSILYTALIAGAASQVLAQGQLTGDVSPTLVRAKIEALLGAYETPSSPEQWRSLGSAATPILTAIAIDENAPPTRRARSLEGLASLGAGSTETFERLAYSEREPLILRMAAVRGLGQLLPDGLLITTLRPLLKATHPQLRGVTAEVLAHALGGCAAIRDQAKNETAAWRSRFTQSCAPAQPPPGHAAAAPANSSASVARVASPAANGSSGQAYTLALGSFTVPTTQLSAPINVDVPANAISLEFIGICEDITARVVVYRLVDPTGAMIFDYASVNNIAKIQPAILPGSFSVALPNSPTVPFHPGRWTFYLVGAKATTANVHAIIKLLPSSTLNMNLFFVGLPQLTARTAPTDPNFQGILSKMWAIYSQIGITPGTLSYIDITGPDAATFTDVTESQLPSLFQLSASRRALDNAVNIFLVHSISGGSLGGFIILGESGGIPGAPVLGATSSGVAVTMADFPNGLDGIAQTLAHETGHWLGLFHTTEASGTAFDPLPDTPECTRVPYDTDNDGIMLAPECVNLDATNLMFWVSAPFPQTLLTPDQEFVIVRNAAQNVDFTVQDIHFPPSPPTPPTSKNIRVPQDFPTIQSAINGANPGDSIFVGPGRWCGALISKSLSLVGESAAIMGCPPGPPGTGPVGNLFKTGFFVSASAPGTSIRQFVFDGGGFSETNRAPLAYGVRSQADNLVVDSNRFLGGGFGVLLTGNNSQVTHNVFNGFTVLRSNGFGGAAILDFGFGGPGTGDTIQFNTISSTVPAGDYSPVSWTNEVDVPLAGIALSAKNGSIIADNKSSITANAHGDAGVGILVTDLTGLPALNLAITNNDGRGSQYCVIITLDQSGQTSNSIGATLRGNFGVNLINGSTLSIRSRSISTLLQCDATTGVCP